MNEKNTFHIIGAGISGLVLAYELLKKGQNVRIYETLEVAGGLTRTETVNNISYDCGPHLFHTNNVEIRKYWQDLLGDKIHTPQLYGANYKNQKIYEYPISFESLKEQFSKSEIKLIKSQIKCLKNKNLKNAKNYNEYVKNLAGDYLAGKFFTDYPQKLWGIPTQKLSAKFAPRRIEIREKKRPFHSGKGKWAGVLKEGCGTLSKKIEERINLFGVYIEYKKTIKNFKTNSRLMSKSNYKSIKELKFTDGKKINLESDDIVISTMPITALAKILGIKNKLWNRSLKIINILIKGNIELPQKYDWLYFDDKNIIFHRVTLQNSFSEFGIPKDHSILSCEIAYSENDKIANLAKNKLLRKCIKDVKSIEKFKDIDIVETHFIDAKSVYPGIYSGYEEELSKLKGKISLYENLYTHGALAEYEYLDTQILTAKSIDLADALTATSKLKGDKDLRKETSYEPSKNFKIGNKKIGHREKCFVIAEIGLNHNGDLEICKKLIDQAKRSGADAVKLQTYNKGRISHNARTARYYEDLVDTQESLPSFVDKIQFNFKDTKKIFDYARLKNIIIFSTPFDIISLDNLEKLNCPAYKISSMDIVNFPLIEAVAKTGKPMILSTGMSEITDISQAANIIKKQKNNNFALLHCVSSYPCTPSNANLPMIKKIGQTFDTIVGFSDHTTGIDITLASVALGAKIIEKHFTLDRKMDGPDHNFSINELELSNLVASIRRIEDAMNDHGYGVLMSEIDTAQNLRRSLFFKNNFKKGDKLNKNSIEIKSPGVGLHPKHLELIIGKKIKRSVLKDTPITWKDFI